MYLYSHYLSPYILHLCVVLFLCTAYVCVCGWWLVQAASPDLAWVRLIGLRWLRWGSTPVVQDNNNQGVQVKPAITTHRTQREGADMWADKPCSACLQNFKLCNKLVSTQQLSVSWWSEEPRKAPSVAGFIATTSILQTLKSAHVE